ncbi:trypsin-like peptidase domain-containing protein [Acetobacteraceae bacterium H6797]|nr:trypsin-like peptidase domain-containing protein [Acetobacteraceae bacterium H6797]
MRRHALHVAMLLAAFGVEAAMAQPKPPPLEAAPQQVTPPGKPPPADASPTPSQPPSQRSGGGQRTPSNLSNLPKPPALSPEEARRQVSSGTGFVVAARRVLTNHHVIKECAAVRLRQGDKPEVEAQVVTSDEDHDLALLSTEADLGPPLPFRGSPAVRRGEGVVTYGFPLAGLLSSGPTLTTGEVSALAGLSNNQDQFQISAPVQPGNSGGPLFDLSGNVIGVVVSKLNAQRIAQRTGDIPQNVNFAVKGEVALDFLHKNNVEPRIANTDATRTAAEVGDLADPSTVFIRCMR